VVKAIKALQILALEHHCVDSFARERPDSLTRQQSFLFMQAVKQVQNLGQQKTL